MKKGINLDQKAAITLKNYLRKEETETFITKVTMNELECQGLKKFPE